MKKHARRAMLPLWEIEEIKKGEVEEAVKKLEPIRFRSFGEGGLTLERAASLVGRPPSEIVKEFYLVMKERGWSWGDNGFNKPPIIQKPYQEVALSAVAIAATSGPADTATSASLAPAAEETEPRKRRKKKKGVHTK